MATKPAGICGMAPSFTSSSRSFSMATATKLPSGATATESGWPPRSQEAVSARAAMSTAARRPEGSVKLGLVLTPTKAVASRTETAVGSPSNARLPSGAGAAGSVMSTKPTAWFGLSE